MRRRRSRRRGFKLKLRNQTIYSIFALGLIFAGFFLGASFARSGHSFELVNDMLSQYFGWTAPLFPLVVLLFGFMFLKLKLFISRPNVAIGYLLIFVCLLSATKAGVLGVNSYAFFADTITGTGARILFLAGLFIGIIILFDTSVDELIGAVVFTYQNIHRLIPKQLFAKSEKSLKEKPIAIKGLSQRDSIVGSMREQTSGPSIVKKEPVLLSEKLVTNTMSSDGIWEYPPLSLLSESPGQKADRGDIKKIATVIEKTLQSFGIEARVVEVNLGPAVTQYALEIALGTKVSKITSLSNDLALATEAPTGQIRIEAPIPGRNLVGIEIPNRSLEVVTLRTMLASAVIQKSKSKLTVSLGLDVSGSPLVADLTKMPHVLVAGTTGSGKSVFVNSFICSLLV